MIVSPLLALLLAHSQLSPAGYTGFPALRTELNQKKVTLEATGEDLAAVLDKLCEQGGYRLEMDSRGRRVARLLRADLRVREAPLESAIDRAVESASGPLELFDVGVNRNSIVVGLNGPWPEEEQAFRFAKTPFNVAVRTLIRSIRRSSLFTYDPNDATVVDLQTPPQPFPVTLVQLLRKAPEAWSYRATFRGNLLAITPDGRRTLPPGADKRVRIDVDARKADVRYLLRAAVASLGKNWTLDVGINGSTSIHAERITPAELLKKIVSLHPIPITIREEDGILNFALAVHPAEIYDYYGPPAVDQFGHRYHARRGE